MPKEARGAERAKLRPPNEQRRRDKCYAITLLGNISSGGRLAREKNKWGIQRVLHNTSPAGNWLWLPANRRAFDASEGTRSLQAWPAKFAYYRRPKLMLSPFALA